MMHVGLVGVLTSILMDVGILDIAVVTSSRGLRATYASRPGDVVVLDFFAEGRHVVVDVVVTTIHRSTILQGATSIPGYYAAKQAEDMKLYAYETSTQPIAAIHGGPHVLVPLLRDGGWRPPRSPSLSFGRSPSLPWTKADGRPLRIEPLDPLPPP